MEKLCIVSGLQVHHQAGVGTLPARPEAVFSFLGRFGEGKTSGKHQRVRVGLVDLE